MGKSIELNIDLDNLKPDVREIVEGMYEKHTLDRFMTLAINKWIVELIEPQKQNTPVQQYEQKPRIDFDFNLLLNILLDIRENTLNIDDKLDSVQTPKIDQEIIKAITNMGAVSTQRLNQKSKEEQEKSSKPISFKDDSVIVESIVISSSESKNDFSNITKLKKLKGGN